MNGSYTVEQLRQKGMEVPVVGFEDEIRVFQALDKKSSSISNGILFVGDSDIKYWTINDQFSNDFNGLPVLNRGFGGARTWETLLYFDDLVLPSQPSIIVYCCGDNDIARLGKNGVQSAVLGFQLFVELIKSKADFVKKVLYLEIHPSPVDEHLWSYISEANEKLEEFCNKDNMLEFVTYKFLLQNESGKLDSENFKEDQYHFSPKFYKRFAEFLKPKLNINKDFYG